MKRLWILTLVILVGIAVMLPTPVALADGHPTTVGEPVLIGPEFCPDVTGDGVVDIADVVTVVKGFGTLYFTTDIGQVVAAYGRVGYCL